MDTSFQYEKLIISEEILQKIKDMDFEGSRYVIAVQISAYIIYYYIVRFDGSPSNYTIDLSKKYTVCYDHKKCKGGDDVF